MYIDAQTIITAAALISAIGVIGGMLITAYKFSRKPAELEKRIDEIQKTHEDIRETHEEDIRKINEEQCLITYGLLACLKGLQEQGCNGPVTDGITRIEKHLNKQAHDMEE